MIVETNVEVRRTIEEEVSRGYRTGKMLTIVLVAGQRV